MPFTAEKPGDFWSWPQFGSQTCHTAADVQHCDCCLSIGGKIPDRATAFLPNARDQSQQILKDPHAS